MSGIRLANRVESGKLVVFDVQARMEEKERKTGEVSVDFTLSVGTKPSVVKFESEGTARLSGKNDEISKMLEADPETKIPPLFQRVYQHVFLSLYLLATLINTPYPPANLLQSGQEQLPVVQMAEAATQGEANAKENEKISVGATEETGKQEDATESPPQTAEQVTPQAREAVEPSSVGAPEENVVVTEPEQTVEPAASPSQEADVAQTESEEVSTAV